MEIHIHAARTANGRYVEVTLGDDDGEIVTTLLLDPDEARSLAGEVSGVLEGMGEAEAS